MFSLSKLITRDLSLYISVTHNYSISILVFEDIGLDFIQPVQAREAVSRADPSSKTTRERSIRSISIGWFVAALSWNMFSKKNKKVFSPVPGRKENYPDANDIQVNEVLRIWKNASAMDHDKSIVYDAVLDYVQPISAEEWVFGRS